MTRGPLATIWPRARLRWCPSCVSARERAERERTVPEESIAEFRAAGLYPVLQPPRFGGYGYDFGTMAKLAAEVSRGCGSTGWVCTLQVTYPWLVAIYPLEAQEEVWRDDTDTLLSGSSFPACIAEPVKSGFRFNGASRARHYQKFKLPAAFYSLSRP